ncbi:MAG: transketolase family protein [Candidatus Liptonbacteria bacterium]|nr:transketolase family protein [Candidatus Liptonbacteria bacterium]
MISQRAKLSKDLFTDAVERAPIRDGYGKGLVDAGAKNEDVVVLCADLTESTRSQAFADAYPHRFFEIGVAEQNLAAVAAGMGISGKIPFISSYAVFSPGRNWEQIRTTIAYNDSNVKIAGAHAGVSVGPDGATHQATEDIAIMRTMPNMKVIVPCDAIEARKATAAAAHIWGPVYIRFAREKTPVMTTERTPFVPGRAEVFWTPKKAGKPDAVIIACGPLVYQSLRAARELEQEGVHAVVINNHTVKPMDANTIIAHAKRSGAVVTVEEHQVAGGMGSAVAEALARHAPVPMEFIGMQDTFGESGAPDELIEKYGMDVDHIKKAVRRAARRKR